MTVIRDDPGKISRASINGRRHAHPKQCLLGIEPGGGVFSAKSDTAGALDLLKMEYPPPLISLSGGIRTGF